MTDIPKGYGLIPGRGRETAQAALQAAADAGVDAIDVRTTADGYIVPEKVLKKYEDGLKKTKAEPETEPIEEAEKPAPKARSTAKKSK